MDTETSQTLVHKVDTARWTSSLAWASSRPSWRCPPTQPDACKGRRRGQVLDVRSGRGEVAFFAKPRDYQKELPLWPFTPAPLPLRLPLSLLQLPPLILLPLRLMLRLPLLPLPLSPLPLSPPLNLSFTPPSSMARPKSPQPLLTSSFQFHARFDLKRPRRY